MPRDTPGQISVGLLASSAAPLSLERTLHSAGQRGLEEVSDRVVAELVRKRLRHERAQGWTVFGLFVTALAAVIAIGTRLGTPVFLGITAAVTASLGIGLGLSTERFFWELFVAEGQLHGLSEEACRQIFERASRAEKMIDVLSACGREPSDEELAGFVR